MLLCDLACENNKIKKEFRVARLHSATNGPDTSWSDDWMVLLAVYPDMPVQSPPAPNKAGDMAPFIPFQNYKDFIVVKTMFWFSLKSRVGGMFSRPWFVILGRKKY